MKIRLLNTGDYTGIEDVKFPVVVEASTNNEHPDLAFVSPDNMVGIGYNPKLVEPDEPPFPFFIGKECEVIND